MKKIPQKIVIIEDSKFLGTAIQIMLSKQGYDTVFIFDSKNAFKEVKYENPDLILLDLMMPDITGLELFSKFKKDEYIKNKPIIILTSKTDALERYPELKEAQGFIPKPFKKEELIKAINNILSG